MITPVFVLGKHRSGTTWLANQLCQHPRVAGVQHVRHHGIHESVYFSRMCRRYGALSEWSSFVELVQVAAASDYFRLAGAGRDFLLGCWPTDHASLFRLVMDRFAAQRGATHWVEKSPSHTVLVHELARWYPDARFIAVQRPLDGVLDSTVALAAARRPGLAGGERRRLVARTAASWARYESVLRAFARSAPHRVRFVAFENMRADLAGSLEPVCTFLGLDYGPRMAERAYRPNTSFPSPECGSAASAGERRLARGIAAAVRRIPSGMLRGDVGGRDRRPLPTWFFSLLEPGADPDSAITDGAAGAVPTDLSAFAR